MDALLTLRSMEDIKISNDTKIQYLSVEDKIYKVKEIDFHNLAIEANKTDLSTIVDVPENEVFPIEELFGEFRVRLCNGG